MYQKLNERIKRRKNESFSSMIVKSYEGMHLSEISKFYPSMINEHDIIDYLVQCREYDIIGLIAKYENNPNSIHEDFDAMSGLLAFCETIQEFSKRICYNLSESVDDWLSTAERGYIAPKKNFARQITTDYKLEGYREFIGEEIGGKRFITKYELEKFIEDAKAGKIEHSVQDYPFSDISLYVMLFQHKKEYHLTKEKIVDLFVPDDHPLAQHRGAANDYLKFEPYLIGEYNKKKSPGFGKKMIVNHFLDPIKVF